MSTDQPAKEGAAPSEDAVLVLGYAEQLRVFEAAWRANVLMHLHEIEDGPLYVRRIVEYLERQAHTHYLLAADSGGSTKEVLHSLARSYELCAHYIRSFVAGRIPARSNEKETSC